MSELPSFPRMPTLLLCILGMIVMTSGFPHPRLHLRSPADSEEPKQEDWDVLFPSISLRDWSIQMMSTPSIGAAANSKGRLMREAWLLGPERVEASDERAWPADWSPQGGGLAKRNMVVADDAAFREKSKLLTSMERQKWLNSYMQKLLVVNSS
ncbi:tuberoinfundibular peptide of 39 residues [Xyrichtys novacula]|uniref:Tuberoinfundibular peptide of 39 residues n=1 Tax=Xyrichtys novacula TaxID=13765 RepID=A0AAV1GLT6_XYRNO|nr:tuberoinfundibular peptide of 39 residues [Xyrichtys novacula]